MEYGPFQLASINCSLTYFYFSGKNTLGTITKKEIAEKCPDISVVTIKRTQAELLTAEKILKIGGGRYTKYTWNNER